MARRYRLETEEDRESFATGVLSELADLRARLLTAPGASQLLDHFRDRRRQRLETVELFVETALRPALQKWTELCQAFDAFRARHGLTWPPKLVDNVALLAWILATAAFIEFLVAAYGFGRHEANILLGSIPASIPTAVILLAGFLMVKTARQVLVKDWKRCVAGGSAAGFFAVLALVALFAIAHFRDRWEERHSAAGLDAVFDSFVERMLADPLNLSDIAVLMLVFSVMVFFFTVYEWWKIQGDPFPGYSAIAREKATAEAGAQSLVAGAQEELKAAIEGTADEFEAVVDGEKGELGKVVADLNTKLLRLRIGAPASWEPSEEDGPAVTGVVEAWRSICARLEELRTLGDPRKALASKADADEFSDFGATEVKSLGEATTTAEAWAWLDAQLAAWAFEGGSDPEEED